MGTRRAAAPLRRAEDPQRATFLELFFDLALVFALFQLSESLIQHLHWSSALQTLVLLLAVWRVWFATTFITDRLDPQQATVQLLVTATMVCLLVMAASLPQAFGKYGPIFAGVYIAVHIGRALFLVTVRGHDLQRIGARATLWSAMSAPLWIAGALTHATARGALWTLAIAVDYAGYALNFPIPVAGPARSWEPPVPAEHLAERYWQVFIVALGELILVSGLALSGGGFAVDRTMAFVASSATTALLLRIYIYRAGELLAAALAAVPKPVRLGRWTTYIHLTMVAGIVVTAVAAGLVIAHPSGRTPPAWAVVILGGPALFLAGRAGFEYIVFARVSRNRPIGILALAALVPVALLVPPLLTSTAATAVLAWIATADTARARRRPPEQPSPPTGGPS